MAVCFPAKLRLCSNVKGVKCKAHWAVPKTSHVRTCRYVLPLPSLAVSGVGHLTARIPSPRLQLLAAAIKYFIKSGLYVSGVTSSKLIPRHTSQCCFNGITLSRVCCRSNRLAIWITPMLEYAADLYALRSGDVRRRHGCHDGNAPPWPRGWRWWTRDRPACSSEVCRRRCMRMGIVWDRIY